MKRKKEIKKFWERLFHIFREGDLIEYEKEKFRIKKIGSNYITLESLERPKTGIFIGTLILKEELEVKAILMEE